jgi:hypothetical protein
MITHSNILPQVVKMKDRQSGWSNRIYTDLASLNEASESALASFIDLYNISDE